ncbi:subtilisin family serine protease [Paenibacillus phyllosphaerae]|uniref:Subtilisin family serine protease n=1 Tax=Paenibacillus phyllosphaerae TaxID=274593 RepID=A0A7W5FLD4_9BACL|nr:S8 family serine peptidase [Paenibacillus phyllosphaerae]MBB3108899.1 subtilisin family serine protease [Paenibacillus phyllosphaerae]
MSLRSTPFLTKMVSIPLAVALTASIAVPIPTSAATASSLTAKGLLELLSSQSPGYVSPTINTKSGKPVRVILTLKQEPAAVSKYASRLGIASMSEAASKRAVASEQNTLISKAESTGIDMKVNYRFDTVLNGMEVTVPADQIPKLAALPGVDSVYENLTYYNLPDQEPPAEGSEDPYIDYEPLQQLGVEAAWEAGLTGKGLKVGVIDTGVDYAHPDLKDAYVGGYNAHTHSDDPYEEIPNAETGNAGTSHGTHVSGTIVGQAKNSASDVLQQGIAPDAELYAYKVLAYNEETGRSSGSSAQVIDGIEHAVEDGMDVINLSLGADGDKSPNSPDAIAINNAVLAGVVAVVASGNAADTGPYYYSMGSPSTSQLAIAVGAATSLSKRFEATLTTEITEVKQAEPPAEDDAAAVEVAPAVKAVSEAGEAPVAEAASEAEQVPAADELAAAATTPAEEAPPSSGRGAGTVVPVPVASPISLMAWKTGQEDFTGLLGTDKLSGVYVGIGDTADYEGKDVKGKVAFISRGSLTFVDKIAIAKAHGAIAAVIFNGVNSGTDADLSESIPGRDDIIGPNGFLGDSLEYIPTFDMAGAQGRAIARQLVAAPGAELNFQFGGDYEMTQVAGDTMASFSSRGPDSDENLSIKPDVVAPGVNILSTLPAYGKDNPDISYAEAYGRSSGTSMATPHIAGLALLLQQQHPDWTPFDIRAALANTSDPISDEVGTLYDVYSQGAGRANIASAIKTPALLQTVENITILDTNLREREVVNYGSSASFGLMEAGSGEKSIKLQLKNFSDNDLTYQAAVVMHDTVTSDPYEPVETPDIDNIDVSLKGTSSGKIKVDDADDGKPAVEEFELVLQPQEDAGNGVYEGEVVLTSAGLPDLHLPFVVHVGTERPTNGFGVQDVSAAPAVYTPDGDGKNDTTDIGYTLTDPNVVYTELNAYGLDDEYVGTLAVRMEEDENGYLKFLPTGAQSFEDVGSAYRKHVGESVTQFEKDENGQDIIYHLTQGTYRVEIFAIALDDEGLPYTYSGLSQIRVEDAAQYEVTEAVTNFEPQKVNTTSVGKTVLTLPASDTVTYSVTGSSNAEYIADNVLKKLPKSGSDDVTVELTVKAVNKANPSYSATTTVPVTLQAKPSNSGGGYTPITPTPPTPSTPTPSTPTPEADDASALALVAQGQLQKTLAADVTTQEGVAEATVTDAAWSEALAAGGTSPVAVIVTAAADQGQTVRFTLTADQVAQFVKAPAGSTIVVTAGGSSLAIPVELVQGLPAGTGLTATIAPKADQTAAFASEAEGTTIIGEPVAFEVQAIQADGAKPIAVPAGLFVKRAFTLPGTIQPNSAGVLYEEGGAVQPIASVFLPQNNGTTIVTVSRAGFSTYAAVTRLVAFTDIAGSWAEPQIKALATKLLINGTTETTFSPKQALTRAEFASLLTRALGLTATGSASFSDVSASDWFAKDAAAAYEAGLITGMPDGTFQPEALLTRDQLSVILARALKLLGITADTGTPSRHAYGDEGQFPGYAKESIEAVTAAGILQGESIDGKSYFNGNRAATRDVAATVLYKLLQKAKLTD